MILTAFLIVMVALEYKWALIITLSLIAIGIEVIGFVLEKWVKRRRLV